MRIKSSIILFLFLFTVIASSKIINIPEDFIKIQEGIANAKNRDTVLVQPGTYYENINFNGKNITLASKYLTTLDTTYINNTIIDASDSGTVVKIISGEDSTALVCGFTLQNGAPASETGVKEDGSGGLGLEIKNSGVTINNCKIKENRGMFIGAVECYNSNLYMNDVIIRDNRPWTTLTTVTGGIECRLSKLVCNNVVVDGNHGDYIGGMRLYKSTGILNHMIISNNSQSGMYGTAGGFICEKNSKLVMENALIKNNSSSTIADGIKIKKSEAYLDSIEIMEHDYKPLVFKNSEVHFSNSTIYPEQSASWEEQPAVTIRGSNIDFYRILIYGNVSMLYCNSSNLNIVNCTILNIDNGTAEHVFTSDKSSVNIVNSIIYSDAPLQETLGNAVINVFYSNFKYGIDSFQNNDCITYPNEEHTINWLQGNISSNPNFVDPDNIIFKLDTSSPCIESGIPFLVYQGDTIVDLKENEYFGNYPDIGAFENRDSSLIRDINTDLTLSTPEDNSVIKNFPISFKWKEVDYLPAFNNYNLIISPNPDLSGSNINIEISEPVFSLDSLTIISEKYYWKVIAKNSYSGKTFTSDINSFKINDLDTNLVLKTPGNNIDISNFPINFKWNPVGVDTTKTLYTLYLSKNDKFENYYSKKTSDTTLTLDTISIASDIYYWKIIAKNSYSGKTYSSQVNSFFNSDLVTNLATISPEIDNYTSDFPISFKWNAAGVDPSQTTYTFFISDNYEFENYYSTETSNTTLTLETLSIVSDVYYWKIIAKNASSGKQYISAINFFKIIKKLELGQNYPNPFNTSTTIKFQLVPRNKNYDTSIRIYNINGSLVKTYKYNKMSPGKYSIEWNGKDDMGQNVANGMYIYRIKSGDYTDSKKMLFIK